MYRSKKSNPRRLAVIAAVVSICPVLLLCGVPSAFAEGPSIASATTIVPGQLEFGNTLNGHQYKNDNCMTGTRTDFESFWALNAVVGDKFVVTWEAVPQTWIEVLPIGTTDFNYTKAKSFLHESISSNGKGEFSFSETSTSGTLPFVVHNALCEPPYGPGPYSFTVVVTHALEVSLPITHALRRVGALSVSTHNPEGVRIEDPAVQVDVQVKGRGGWQTIGRGTAASASIAYRIPASLRHVRRVTLRALASGTGYVPASSIHQKVRTL
jgi:hypothetical protein